MAGSPEARLPTFFLLGAGRSGSSSLAAHLSEHPDIFFPHLKEPSFLASSFQVISDPADYVDLYTRVDAAQTGDGSHIYLEDPRSPDIIRAFRPDARFLLIFRNPADRAFALYLWMAAKGFEPLPTFEAALAAEEERFASDEFRREHPQSFWNSMYFRSGLFGEQVARYLDRWPRDRFFATTFYEYLTDPGRVIGEIEEFLGVEQLDLGAPPHLRESVGTRSNRVSALRRRVFEPHVRKGRARLSGLSARIDTWNQDVPKPRIDPRTRASLVDRYRDDLALLTDLLGVDVLAEEARWRAARDGDAPDAP